MVGNGRVFFAIILIGGLSFAFLADGPLPLRAATVDELETQLAEKKQALEDIDEKVKQFQQKVQEKRQTAQTLAGQIELINNNIEALSLSLQRTQAQIDKTDAEVESVEYDIAKKEDSIDASKSLLGQYIRQLQEIETQSTIAIFLKYTSLSDAITESNAASELQDRTHQTIVAIQQEKQELLEKKQELDDFKQTLDSLKTRQQQQQTTLKIQNNSKQEVLRLTNAEEAQYQSQLEQLQSDAKSAQAAISALDNKIREEIGAQGISSLGSVGILDWPVEPIYGVSCPFHCGGYPYEYLIGPHTGTDIPTSVGTPIKAPADGYVGRTHDSGGRGYSYILLVHGDNITTVYGHVSGFAIAEGKFVKRGDTLGYTGGAPGSRGAGLSSGPHLHFEVRKNNVAVDAQKYLTSR